MAQNNCSPSNVYGGFEHTLFLGCSVISYSASVGWNEQTSEVTVQLIEDTCSAPADNPKHYWDADLQEQTTTSADPGFIGHTIPIVGVPVMFRMGDFEFSGIIQSWEKSDSTSGNIYTVKIIDPRNLLDNVQLIVGDYVGAVGSQYNLFNCLGFMESFGIACPLYSQDSTTPGVYIAGNSGPDGAVFGTFAGGFGGAGLNENGMTANTIITAFNILANSIPKTVNQFSSFGRVVYKGTASGNYGVMSADSGSYSEYFVDISELPTVPSYWRINSTSISLLEFVSQICEDAGYDYYWELVPIRGVNSNLASSGIAKFIKLRTVARLTQPDLDQIEDFIAANEGSVISSTYGRELRNELMGSFIIGGQKETVYQASSATNPDGGADGTITQGGASVAGCDEIDDMILPFYGVDGNNDFIVPCKDAGGKWEFTVDTTAINLNLLNGAFGGNCTINEVELQFALAGFDAWMAYESNRVTAGNPTDIGTLIFTNILGGKKAHFTLDHIIGALAGEEVLGRDIAAGRPNAIMAILGANASQFDDIKFLFEWVSGFAENAYGTKYAVRIPFTCVRQDSESGVIINNDEPQQDGWTEFSTILGMPTGSAAMSIFINDSGKVDAMVRFDNASEIDIGKLDIDNYTVYNNKLYVKCDVESSYVYHDYSTFFGPRVVLTIPAPIIPMQPIANQNELCDALRVIAKDIWGLGDAAAEEIKKAAKRIGGKVLSLTLPYIPLFPDAASFGIKSNVLTYGPWVNPGLPGQIRVEKNDGLVPWEYGGLTTLNLAGDSYADEGITNMWVGEMGSISSPGYPTIPLGAELGAVAGGFYGAGTHLVENRSHSTDSYSDTLAGGGAYNVTYGFFSYGGQWTGVYGPSVTGISVNTSTSQISTDYTFRTFTPKFGRFAKWNAERLKKLGKLRLNFVRKINNAITQRQQIRLNRLLRHRDRIKELNLPGDFFPKTPHEVIVGKYYDWNETSHKRPIIATIATNELDRELDEDYDTKAFIGLDGLILPISMDGDGGLPQYMTPNGGITYLNGPRESKPPMIKSSSACTPDGSSIYLGTINLDHLNPWSNPAGFSRSTVVTDRSTDTTIGHCFEYAGRGTGVDSGLGNAVEGLDTSEGWGYDDDYRIFAFRGPFMIQQWGYDLDGKPVPNSADNEADASGGTFTASNLTKNFLPGWLRKPHTWPVAPLDIRLDRIRGVWTTPPSRRNILVQLCDCLAPSSNVTANVLTPGPYYDDSGNVVNTASVVVYDNINTTYPSGAIVYVNYDAVDNKYYVIHGPDWITVDVATGDMAGTTLETGVLFNTKRLTFGSGFEVKSVTGEGECQPSLHIAYTGSNILVDTTGCVSDSVGDDISTTFGYSKFIFGNNLNIRQHPDVPSSLLIGSYLNINGQKIADMTITGGLQFDYIAIGEDCPSGDLTLEVIFDESGTGVEVVTSVSCSGEGTGSLIVNYNTLLFDKYGRFSGIA